MIERNLSLSPRVEDTREIRSINVVSFSLTEIKERFDNNIASIRSQFDVAQTLKESGRESDQKYIFRSQIVYLESAFDFYLHELNKYGLRKIYSGDWPKTPKYRNLKVPIKQLERALESPDTSEWFLEYVNDAYSRDVFTAYEYMKDQMNMLGINLCDLLKDAFPGSIDPFVPSRTAKNVITQLYDRRNQIAHQTDRAHADASENDISKEYVESCISDIVIIVDKIHQAAACKG